MYMCATRKKSIRAGIWILLLSVILPSLGCIGLTSASRPGSSQSAAMISVGPSSIGFGAIALNSTVSQSVTISNGGGSNLTVTSVSTTASGVTLAGISIPLVIAPGQQSTFSVIYSPQTAGTLSGNVSVSSDVSNSPSTVSLSGSAVHGVAHSVALQWTPSTSTVPGYNVYRSEISGGPFLKIDFPMVSANSYSDTSVQGGLTYYYVVTSVTSTGAESAYSAQTSATIPTP